MISHLLAGLAWLAFAVALVLGRQEMFQQAAAAHEKVWGRLGVRRGSERINRILAMTVIFFLAAFTAMAALCELYTAVTGRDWPFAVRTMGRLMAFLRQDPSKSVTSGWLSNIAAERTAGSHSLAAAAHRGR